MERLSNALNSIKSHLPSLRSKQPNEQVASEWQGRSVIDKTGKIDEDNLQEVISTINKESQTIKKDQNEIKRIEKNVYLDRADTKTKKNVSKRQRQLKFAVSITDRKQLKSAKKILSSAKTLHKEIEVAENRRQDAVQQLKNSTNSEIQLLAELLTPPAPGARTINLNNFSAEDISNLNQRLNNSDDSKLKELVGQSLQRMGTDDAGDAKLRLEGTVRSGEEGKLEALHELFASVNQASSDEGIALGLRVDVTGLNFLNNKNEGLPTLVHNSLSILAGGREVKKFPSSSGQSGSHKTLHQQRIEHCYQFIPLVGNAAQNEQLDRYAIEADDSDSGWETDDPRMTQCNFQRNFSSQTDGIVRKLKEDEVLLMTQNVGTYDADVRSRKEFGGRQSTQTVNSYTLPEPTTVGEFTASANGITAEGPDHTTGGCEDRMVVETVQVHGTNCMIPAIIDGHSGSNVASYVQQHLTEHLARELEKLDSNVLQLETENDQKLIKRAIKQAFKNLQTEIESEIQDTSGADVCCPLIINGYVFTATLGDSKAMMITPEEKPRYLTPDTEVENTKHTVEAAMRGNSIHVSESSGVRMETPQNARIPTSRSLGDGRFNTLPVPVVTCTKIPAQGCRLFVTSDGITDIATGQEIADYLAYQVDAENQIDVTQLNRGVHQKAASAGGCDDKSSVLIELVPTPRPEGN